MKTLHHRSGITLLEIMVAMAIITIGALAMMATFGSISRSILVSKSRSIAVNLAQEKVEYLKNISYYRLLVTTSSIASTEVGLGGFTYDTGNYPPEDLRVGQIDFERRVMIQKVTDSGGTLATNNWWDADTGLKQVTSYVIWYEGAEWKKVALTNLRDNPNRVKMDAQFTGVVQSGAFNLQDAVVETLENQLLSAVTDNTGSYSIKVAAGGYNVKATKRGYFEQVQSATAPSNGSLVLNFNLAAKAVGTIQGTAYVNSHLVLAAVCASVDGDDVLEYVEVYNPTPLSYLMADASGASYRIEYVRASDGAITQLNWENQTLYSSLPKVIAANGGYFLMASSPSVKGVAADGYYSNAALSGAVPQSRIPLAESGGIRLVSQGVYEASGTVVDAIGWGHGSSPFGPATAREGNGFDVGGGSGFGFGTDEVLERMAYSTSTHSTMDLLPAVGIHAALGNAYDTNDNSADWVQHTHTDDDIPQNSSTIEAPGSGAPASGALVFVDDGLSASSIASAVAPLGSFSVTSIATGTWSITLSSGSYAYSQEGISVLSGSTVMLGNVFLSTPATMGYVSGRILNSVGGALSGILVRTSGGVDTSDTNGYYRFQVLTGTYVVTANPDNTNSAYTVSQDTWVMVNAGRTTNVPDMTVLRGGMLRGFVTANGIDPLPGIPFIATATATGAEMAADVSDSQGVFQLPDLPVGSYVVTPQLEVGESASPSSITATTVSTGTVFIGTITVTNAFGTVAGAVTKSSAAITTGALIIAVVQPNTVGANPPTINQTLRNAGVVYYAASSDADGTYQIPLRGGVTYNLYGWYKGSTDVTPTQLTKIGTVTAGATTVVNFDW